MARVHPANSADKDIFIRATVNRGRYAFFQITETNDIIHWTRGLTVTDIERVEAEMTKVKNIIKREGRG